MRCAVWLVLWFLSLCTSGCRSLAPAPVALPPVSFWYWHTPFVLNSAEIQTLSKLKVQELFIRASTLVYSDDGKTPMRSVLPQVWKSPAKEIPVHLVFPVDASLVRRLETIPEDVFAQGVVEAIRAARNEATKAGVTVAGAQIDLDSPTRLLPRYARVLQAVKAQLDIPLSITLLTSWYDSRSLAMVLDAVDFSVPQFYEAQTSPTQDTIHPISSLSRFRRGLTRAEKLGKPFRIGLPAYGHALVYDNRGKLRGMFRDAPAAELLNRPDQFKFLGATPMGEDGKAAPTADAFIGEERVEFGPTRKAVAFHLAYDLPTPEMLRRHLDQLRKGTPRNCAGIILYRFPERNEESVLPLTTMESILSGQVPKPNLRITLRTRRQSPFDLVEATDPAKVERVTELFVTVENVGDGPSRVAPTAVDVELRLSLPTMDSARPGTFDKVEGFAGSVTNRASIARADGLHLCANSLRPGEKRIVGPISLKPGAQPTVTAAWRVALPGGYETVTGTLTATPLPTPEVERP